MAPSGYEVRRSTRARRVRVSVEPDGGVVVTLPRRAPARPAPEAGPARGPWVPRRRRPPAGAAAELAPPPGTVPYLGRALILVPEDGRTRAHRRGDLLLVPAQDPRPALERFYRRAARAEIGARLDAAVARAGTAYASLTIR